MFIVYHSYIITCNGGKMVVVSHLFLFLIKSGRRCPGMDTVSLIWNCHFPTAPFFAKNAKNFKVFLKISVAE